MKTLEVCRVKALVVFDSAYGNTAQIARAIGEGLATGEDEIPVRQVGDVQPEDLTGLDVLVVGSPTQRMNFIEGVGDFLESIPHNGLVGVRVAAFDTRISNEDMQAAVQSRVTRFFIRLFLHRFAATPIAAELKKKGGQPVIKPEGFFVTDTEGPLKAGELERATAWGQQIAGMLAS
jgi:flavodoxin I